jgi:ankyrin repeat protein
VAKSVNDLKSVFLDADSRGLIEQTVDDVIADGNVNAVDKDGKNVLLYAIEIGDADLVSKILAAGADPNTKNLISDSALLCAIDNSFADENKAAIIRILLEAGADANAINTSGYTPLKLALDLHRMQAIKPLLAYGAVIPEGYGVIYGNVFSEFSKHGEGILRIVIWGEPEKLQQYLAANQQLSIHAVNNALDAIRFLKTNDRSQAQRAAVIQKQLEDFKDLHYPSRWTHFYRSIVNQWQKIKSFFDLVLYKTAEVKLVMSESVDTTSPFKSSEQTVAKKDYLGAKRKNLVRDFNNKENIEPANSTSTRPKSVAKPRE